jgi:bla regulator protein blaR1
MEPSTTYTLLSDHIIKALCNTLMHSLWQGILLAVIAGAIIIFTKKASAAFRYNLLVGALTLFTFGVTATFIAQLRKPAANGASYQNYSTAPRSSAIQTTTAPAISVAPVAGNITASVTSYFNTHYNIVVLIWFLIICAKSVQMAVGLHGVYYLKRTKVAKVGEDWENRLLQLAKQLQIEQVIRLMESGIARVPMVVGHLKPLILIAIGLINSLTTNEVEAILIHELAHIRRRDYLVNLLQSLMEIVFFFNPAVLWISQLIKTERENCCDDLAIAQSRSKANYVRALVSCAEYRATGAAYVMAFPGTKNTLLYRVNRIAGNRNYSLNPLEKTILAACLVVLGLTISAFTAHENVKKALNSVAADIHHDAGAEHKQSVSVHKSTALSTQLKQPALSATDTHKRPGMANSPLALPAKPDTNKLAFDTSRAIGRELYRENLLTDTDHLSIDLNERELIVNGVRMPQEVHERIYRQFGRQSDYGGGLAQPYENRHPGPYDAFLKERSEEIAHELLKENLVKDKTYFAYKLSRDEFSIDGIKQPDELRRRIVDEFFKPDDDFNIGYISKDPGSHAYADQNNYPTDAYRSRDWEAYSRQMAAERQRWEAERDKKLVADLLQDGLITDPNNVTFTLSDKAVTINGEKQSDAVYKKYKEKYMPAIAGSGWNWNYSHHE